MGEREREHGLLVRNQIVQSMWDDVGFRAKKLGPGNRKSIKKQISQLADHFEYSLFAYDEGITSDDKQLASTIWTQFFNKNCDDYVQVELMVKYIRANVSVWREPSRMGWEQNLSYSNGFLVSSFYRSQC